jgi:hypothetical protein
MTVVSVRSKGRTTQCDQRPPSLPVMARNNMYFPWPPQYRYLANMSSRERKRKIVEPHVNEEREEVEEISEEEGAEATSTLAPTTSVPTPSHDEKNSNGNLTTFDSVHKYLKGKEVGTVHVVSTPQMPALLEINPETVKKYKSENQSSPLLTFEMGHNREGVLDEARSS